MKPSTTDQIQSDLDRFCAAWKTNDGASLGGFFIADGTLINPFGQRADGRTAVAAMYTQFFGSLLLGTSTSIQTSSVRAVGPDHALVDAEQIIRAADGTVVLAVHLAALLRRESDGWRFADARPYTYASAPA